MKVMTLMQVALFCILFAGGVLLVGRALDYQQQQYCAKNATLADSSICKP